VVEGWDLTYVRTNYSFTSTIDRLTRKLQAVSYLHSGDSPNQARPITVRFNIYTDRLQACKKWYESRIKVENEAMKSQTGETFDPDIEGYDFREGFSDVLDDSVWQELISEWPGNQWMGN
jgi:hypothetical protein